MFLLFPLGDVGIVRRRHSSVLDSRSGSLASGFIGHSLGLSSPYGAGYQPGTKRRTRSEDKLLRAVGHLEDDLRTSDEENKRIGWPANWVNRLRPSGNFYSFSCSLVLPCSVALTNRKMCCFRWRL